MAIIKSDNQKAKVKVRVIKAPVVSSSDLRLLISARAKALVL
jgi:hypothetical protein